MLGNANQLIVLLFNGLFCFFVPQSTNPDLPARLGAVPPSMSQKGTQVSLPSIRENGRDRGERIVHPTPHVCFFFPVSLQITDPFRPTLRVSNIRGHFDPTAEGWIREVKGLEVVGGGDTPWSGESEEVRV